MKSTLIALFVIAPILIAGAREETLGDILKRYKEEDRITEEEFTELYKAWQKDVSFLREKYLAEREKPRNITLEGASTTTIRKAFPPKTSESKSSSQGR